MNQITLQDRVYVFSETFDVNLAADYEIDRWDIWHMIREFVSNALDAVDNNPNLVNILREEDFIDIVDKGNGYPIVYAKRIGASSKRDDASSIGQFGEGTKMAMLTALRRGLAIRLASQDWLIAPKLVEVEEGLQVLAYDIYKATEPITGSIVSIEAADCVRSVIGSLSDRFLQFNDAAPLNGQSNTGILPRGEQARIYNKGVYIRDIDALFSYALSLDKLNRDRDLIDEQVLSKAIAETWGRVDDSELITTYFSESERVGNLGVSSKLLEFKQVVYPVSRAWLCTFRELYGDKAVLFTDALAAKEAALLGFKPVKLEYYGRFVAEMLGVKRDTEVCRADYEFSWAQQLSNKEQGRLTMFRKIAELVGLEAPSEVRLYDSYTKSEFVLGLFNSGKDEIYLRRDHFNGAMVEAFDTYLHELNHRATGADDYDRSFADGLSRLASRLALRLAEDIGFSTPLKVTPRGVQLPRSLSLSADSMKCRVATLSGQVLIEVGECVLQAPVPGVILRPYATERDITYYKGSFYANMPSSIRELLPSELLFYIRNRASQDK